MGDYRFYVLLLVLDLIDGDLHQSALSHEDICFAAHLRSYLLHLRSGHALHVQDSDYRIILHQLLHLRDYVLLLLCDVSCFCHDSPHSSRAGLLIVSLI